MFLVIVYSYLVMFSAKEDTKQTKRDCFDPRCEDMKTYKELSKFNMAKQAAVQEFCVIAVQTLNHLWMSLKRRR